MRPLLGLVAVLGLVGSVVLSGSRFLDLGRSWPVMVASFSSYAVAGYAVVLVLALLLRRRAARRRWLGVVALLALVGLVAQGWWLAPQFTGGSRARSDLTVMSSNLEFGRGDAATVVRTVASGGVDVLVLEEVTPASLVRLRDAGLDDLLPHEAGTPAQTASGTMVFSRWRLGAPRPVPLGHVGLAVRVEAPGPFDLVAVHAAMPLADPGEWLRDQRTLARLGPRSGAHASGLPTLMAGDFNATLDHAPLRRVLDAGLRDAAEQSGSGWQSTWPTRWRRDWLRPVIAIDHVLASDGLRAVRTRTVEVPRTDHRALVVELTEARG